jgi:hypothetical protein
MGVRASRLPGEWTLRGVAPDVAAVDRSTNLRTKEYAPLHLNAKRGIGCLEFGDMRAVKYGYENAGLPTPSIMVTVNSRLLVDEYGASLFGSGATNLAVYGLKDGDKVEVLIVGPWHQTVTRCRGIPTMDTQTVCDQGYLLWERRAYVY